MRGAASVEFMQYNYILLTDNRFISYALSELKERLGMQGRLKTMALGKGIYLAQIDLQNLDLAKTKGMTFSHGLVPVASIFDQKLGAEQITEIVGGLANKGEPLRMELVSLGAKRGESAKDTEVKVGQALEAKGFSVSLKAPSRLFYAIVGDGLTVIATSLSSDLEDISIDHFRIENKDQDKVNRAEVKMREAFSTFKITGPIRLSIDIGASPGGWTNFLLKKGSKVVAIDKGVIEYDRLQTKDVKVIEDPADYEAGHDLIHIRANLADSQSLPIKEGSADLLAIDINTDFIESSKIAVSLSKYLKSDGMLIMTLKLPKISDAGRIYMAKDALSKDYKVDAIKKLHHNRMELTLLAHRL